MPLLNHAVIDNGGPAPVNADQGGAERDTLLQAPFADNASSYSWARKPQALFLLAGLLAFILPTMFSVAKASWSTEQGGHGPIVFAIAIWLIGRDFAAVRALARPGSPVITAILLVPLLLVFIVARITSIIEIEAAVMYASVLVVAYQFIGRKAMQRIWFALIFLIFAFPPPDTLYAAITQPLKIAISQWSVEITHMLGYPVAVSGVVIQIAQYQLLVAAACAGVNSLLSLTALGSFYSYFRHQSNFPHMLVLLLFILPIAVAVNLVRVIMLILITYYLGEAAGQGFLHEVAGLSMFLLALILIHLVDLVTAPIRTRLFGQEKRT